MSTADTTPTTPDAAQPTTDTTQVAPAQPSTDQFDQEAERVRNHLKGNMDVNQMSAADAAPIKWIDEQIDVARSLYLGGHFNRHELWTSETRNFDVNVGFIDFGLQVRAVGADRQIRIGFVSSGPSDVGGWESYQGAPTE